MDIILLLLAGWWLSGGGAWVQRAQAETPQEKILLLEAGYGCL